MLGEVEDIADTAAFLAFQTGPLGTGGINWCEAEGFVIKNIYLKSFLIAK